MKNIKKDLFILVFLLPIVFLIASVALTGWPQGLIPNINYPYLINDDGAFSLIQKIIEGSIYENNRIGFPLGSSTKDYPQPDGLNLFLIKLLSIFTPNWVAVHNLFYLLTFPAVFLTSYIVLRVYKINHYYSILGSISFTFLPFHFVRLHHLFLANYAVVPLFWLIALKIFRSNYPKELNFLKISFYGLCLSFMGALGIYYAIFGMILIITTGIFTGLNKTSYEPIKHSIFFIIPIIIGLLVHLLIPLLGTINENMTVVNTLPKRSIIESELYAFSLPQLLSPTHSHNIEFLSKIASFISSNTLNANENTTSSLGIIGSLGFLLSLLYIFLKLSGRKIEPKFIFISTLLLILFLFGLSGGFGSIFAFTITSSLRAWNRVSIFIGFGSILLFFMFLNYQSSNLIKKFKTNKLLSKVFNIFLVILTSIIIIDLIPRPCINCSSPISNKFQEKLRFFNEIENHLSPNASVYQMPFMQYPEVPPKNNIKDYELFDGFLLTKNIKWSYGTIKNTQADILMMEISQLPLEKKIQFLKKIGFDGIYYNANGYVNDDIYNNLEGLLGKPIFVNKSLGLFFFDLGKNNDLIFSKNNLRQLLNEHKK